MHQIILEEGDLIEVRVSGTLTPDDYDKLIPAWERMIARQGRMRMLLVMEDFHGWDLGAAWDDLHFGVTHASKVERIAVVGEQAWQKWMIKLGKFFAPETLKYFDARERAEAERWVRLTNMKMSTAPKPRVIVITGAAAGVGRATACLFAESEGAHIGLIARGQEALEGAKRDVEERGGQAIICPCDVADAAAVEAAAERIERELGPIDVWVNVAMTSVFAFIKDTTPEEFKRVTEVCYLGYVHGTLAALKRMMPRNRGHIVQVGSALAYRGIPLQAAYCASKHAIQGFMDSLRSELIHQGSSIVPVMVQMPALNTPQFDWCKNKLTKRAQPVPPIYQPEVAARAIVFASKNTRREIYVGLPTVIAIIGNKLFPRLGDLYLGKTGVNGQLTDEREAPDRPDNLYQPVDGDPGAHGRFDARAHPHSPQLWTDMHRNWIAGGLLAGTVGLLGAWFARRRD